MREAVGEREERAEVVEVFSSFQGEGPLLGCRQVFVRLQGCNLECVYCDTPQARQEQPHYRVEQTPGRQDFRDGENPITAAELARLIAALDRPRGLHHSAAITGGEPLLRAGFLRELLPLLQRQGWTTYLETNGTLPEALEQVVEGVGWVSLDIKLPSALEGREFFAEAEACLRIARRRQAFVKVVVTPESTAAEIERAVRTAAEVDRGVPFVLQPATPSARVKSAPSTAQLLEWFELAKRQLDDVRVMPQMHKQLGLL
ncbi:MAG: 7-carboxy-7-deazaguanine synthase QueE [Armatimonadota bacterium]